MNAHTHAAAAQTSLQTLSVLDAISRPCSPVSSSVHFTERWSRKLKPLFVEHPSRWIHRRHRGLGNVSLEPTQGLKQLHILPFLLLRLPQLHRWCHGSSLSPWRSDSRFTIFPRFVNTGSFAGVTTASKICTPSTKMDGIGTLGA